MPHPHRILLTLLCASAGLLPAGEAVVARLGQTMVPIVEAVKPLFAKNHPDIALSITGCPTSVSIKALIAGESQLGAIARELKSEEKAAHPELTAIPIGRDAIAFVVNASNPVVNLTKQQLVGIFTGTIANWKEVGGGDASVAVVGRTEANSINEFLEGKLGLEHQIAGEGKDATVTYKVKGAATFGNAKFPMTGLHKDALPFVLRNPHSLTFVPLGHAMDLMKKGAAIKIISFDGIEPSAANVNNGSFTLSRPLYLLTKGQSQGPVKDLVDLVISPEGQALVAERGFVPLK